MVYLPNEIINLILSYREINPVSLLIKDSVEIYNKKKLKGDYYYANTSLEKCKLFSYYFDTLIHYKMDKLELEFNHNEILCEEIKEKIRNLNRHKFNIRHEIQKLNLHLLNPEQRKIIDDEIIKGNSHIYTEIMCFEDLLYKIEKVMNRDIRIFNFTNFFCDINHSIICCGTIKKGYMFRNNFKFYDEYDNKYRNEIYEKCDRKKYTMKESIQVYYPHLLNPAVKE